MCGAPVLSHFSARSVPVCSPSPHLSASAMAQPVQAANGDVAVANSPNDTVSSMLFSPTNNFLVTSSWNKEVAVYEVQASGQAQAKAKVTHTHPVLCVDWSADGAQVVSAGTDNLAKLWNLATNQEITIGQHQAPIKSIHYVKEMNMVVTGSFDKTIKYWSVSQRAKIKEATVQRAGGETTEAQRGERARLLSTFADLALCVCVISLCFCFFQGTCAKPLQPPVSK